MTKTVLRVLLAVACAGAVFVGTAASALADGDVATKSVKVVDATEVLDNGLLGDLTGSLGLGDLLGDVLDLENGLLDIGLTDTLEQLLNDANVLPERIELVADVNVVAEIVASTGVSDVLSEAGIDLDEIVAVGHVGADLVVVTK